jgi:hypothetical protein
MTQPQANCCMENIENIFFVASAHQFIQAWPYDLVNDMIICTLDLSVQIMINASLEQ